MMKRWIGALAATVIVALFATPVYGTGDETSYEYRLQNLHPYAAQIRCGSSGSWTFVSTYNTENVTCTESSVETTMQWQSTITHYHNCSDANKPIFRITTTRRWNGQLQYATLCIAQ